MNPSLTRRGFAWSAALPAFWLLLYYGLVVQVRLSLGRWPVFGEQLKGWLSIHERAVGIFIAVFWLSLFLAGAVLVIGLFIRRRRHISVYMLSYGAAIWAAYSLASLAPGPFLNWFLD